MRGRVDGRGGGVGGGSWLVACRVGLFFVCLFVWVLPPWLRFKMGSVSLWLFCP